MLPLCSAISNPYPNPQVCLYGGCRTTSFSHKPLSVKCIKLDLQDFPFKTQKATFISLKNTFLGTSIPNEPDVYSEYLSKGKESDGDVFAGINESLSALVCDIDTAITDTFKTVNLSVEGVKKGVGDLVEGSLDKLKVSFSGTLSGVSSGTKGVSSKAGVVAVDALRHGIVAVEEVLARGAMFVVYGYASVKDMLPTEIHDGLNSLEDVAFVVLRPVGTAFQQVYIVLEGFETSLGINPSDPIVPFVLLLGGSATLWVSYWFLTYAGYAGDLSPTMTFDLLNGKERVALIDVRPEEFRERDGIPDLRRTARFRYASVAFPEVETNVKKLLKSGKDLDDTLVAVVIRNLKVAQGGSKVIVMDADGLRSKGIARALRKVGIKRPYLVQGGFRSWVQEGLRIKEPKPETTFTILNEEAEAILEDITPQQVIGYGVGFLAAAYALLEWETTLQLIAIFGVGLTIYQRVASYEDSKDFNRDVRQLLVPVRLGGQAISWAAGKLETNRNGLPTLPSSVNVQSRVLQAAAKHESQPPDSEEQTTSPDLSEA